MKNLILVLSIAISLISLCSCNGDEPISPDDSIVGQYKLIKISQNGNDITNDCTKRGTLTFLANNSLTMTYYNIPPGGVCSSNGLSGTWRKSSSKYFLTLDGDDIFSEFNGDTFTVGFNTPVGIEYTIDYKK